MPGGLDDGAARVDERRLQQGQPAGRQPLAHDAEFRLGLYRDIEVHGPFGAVGRAADAEAAPPLGVGACPFGDAALRVGEGLVEVGATAESGQRLVGPQRGGLAAAAASREEGERPQREEGAPVPGEGGEPEFGDVRPLRTRPGVRAGQHRRQG